MVARTQTPANSRASRHESSPPRFSCTHDWPPDGKTTPFLFESTAREHPTAAGVAAERCGAWLAPRPAWCADRRAFPDTRRTDCSTLSAPPTEVAPDDCPTAPPCDNHSARPGGKSRSLLDDCGEAGRDVWEGREKASTDASWIRRTSWGRKVRPVGFEPTTFGFEVRDSIR